ncbi:hypothetical protein OBBRIDRAFT_439898 [Obba rivulosa]|uniref:Uncharacterized protein n=1 Tax=Obba rivulosa TaxID=1052685 RepID=A0A8E2AGJ6_9APHY|nr:hypothetical protein OBBRIDRAFT_439898 [Obba rivulosa]
MLVNFNYGTDHENSRCPPRKRQVSETAKERKDCTTAFTASECCLSNEQMQGWRWTMMGVLTTLAKSGASLSSPVRAGLSLGQAFSFEQRLSCSALLYQTTIISDGLSRKAGDGEESLDDRKSQGLDCLLSSHGPGLPRRAGDGRESLDENGGRRKLSGDRAARTRGGRYKLRN